MAEIKYISTVGGMMHLHYADGSVGVAYPDGRGQFLPNGSTGGSTVTPPAPGDPPPTPPPSTGDWLLPLVGGQMTSPFGPRGFDGVASYHYGIDFSTTTAPLGGNVIAPTDLVVTIARTNWGSGGSAGNCVKAHTTDGAYTFNFYHMAPGTIAVTEGQTITKGTLIGREGQTGNVTGTHLHFEVYQGVWNDPWPPPYNNGAVVTDPAPILQAHGVRW